MTVSLTCTDIHLAPPPGVLVEGKPLKLTCTVSGHTPKDNNKVKIHYWSSGEPIVNCPSDTTELPNSDIHYHKLTSTCELSAHSTRSNSGDYSCSASIEHNMVVSSGDVRLNVEPGKDLKIIIGAAVGSGVGVVVLAFLAINISISYKIRKRRRHQEQGNERARLLDNDNADVGDNVRSKGHC